MRKWIVPLLVVVLSSAGVVGSPPAAHAAACTLDEVPAATLLLPYFEVDLANPNGRTTLLGVVNAGARARLAHVVLWTDLGVPTLAFDVYLTGYGVQTLNLRDVFAGRLPQTADQARDPMDSYSPGGRFSEDASFPGCEAFLPPAPLSAAVQDHLRKAHTGLASPLFADRCAGRPIGDSVARGYVTVDVARRCSSLFPGDLGYFGPDGAAGMDNVLFGDFIYLDPEKNLSDGNALVAIEAAPGQLGPGAPTFYGRLVGNTGADAREPLPTRWAMRFLSGGPFSSGTDAIAWREVRVTGPFECNQYPSWYPAAQREILIFDEQEHPLIPHPCPFECPPMPVLAPFPGAAGRVKVGGAAFPVPYNFGWLLLDLSPFQAGAAPTQSWVGEVHSAAGRFSVGFAATPLDSGCNPDTGLNP